jgi:hypothetical protein
MRFTIRDLLLLMVVVALALGWWLDRSTLVAARKLAEEAQASAIEDYEWTRERLSEYHAAIRRRGLSIATGTGNQIEVMGQTQLTPVEPDDPFAPH